MKTKKTEDALKPAARKSEYRPPELVEYGTVQELTQRGGSNVPTDNTFPLLYSGSGGR